MSFGGSLKDTNTTTNSQQNVYGTRTPTLSNDWLTAFKNSQSNLNAGGYTPDQQKAINLGLGSVQRTGQAVSDTNGLLGGSRDLLGSAQPAWNSIIYGQAPAVGAGVAGTRDAAYAGDVTAGTGADFMGAYKNPYDQQVVDASVNDYNIAGDRALNQIRAQRDSAGAFGDRSALADAQFQADQTRGLGTLVSGLRQAGFNTEAGLGQQDASRKLLADQGNQTTKQGLLEFNAGATNTANLANAAAFTDVSKANAQNILTNNSQRMQAIQGIQDNIKAQAGLTQQQLDNVFKGSQIDTDAAKSLFDAGQISQEQLNQILQLAGEGNGYTYSQDTTGHSNSNSITAEAHAASLP